MSDAPKPNEKRMPIGPSCNQQSEGISSVCYRPESHMTTCCTTVNIKYLNDKHEKKQSIGEGKEIRLTFEANMHRDL